jgi:hypothetical protein
VQRQETGVPCCPQGSIIPPSPLYKIVANCEFVFYIRYYVRSGENEDEVASVPKHYAMKAYKGRGCKDPLILGLCP